MAGGFLGQTFSADALDLSVAVESASKILSDRGRPTMCAFVLEEDPKNTRVEFESFPSEGIIEGYAATFKNIGDQYTPQPASRMFTGGDWQQIVLDLEFRAGDLQSSDGVRSANALASNMEKKVRLLQAMSFPKPNSPRAASEKILPSSWRVPFVLLIIGDFITYRGYVESTEINWKMPVVPGSARPMAAGVTVTFLPTMAIFPDFFDVQDPNLRGSTVDVIDALSSDGTPRQDIRTFGDNRQAQQLAEQKAKIAKLQQELSDGKITQDQFDEAMQEFKNVEGAGGNPVRPR